MEEIQFLNYVFSLAALLIAAAAFYLVWRSEEDRAREIKDLKEKISIVADRANDKKR